MLASFSSKAIASKARAMYGKRLRLADYTEMMKKSTVAEIALYLRDNTYYEGALMDISPENTHRGQLEDRLRTVRYQQYAALTRYSFSRTAGFWQYLFLWDETEQVINLMRYIGAGSEGEYYASYSSTLQRYCSYDLTALLHCRDYDSLMEVMQGTEYGKILKKHPPKDEREKNQIDLVFCERDLKVYYYDRIFALIGKEFAGGAAEELTELFMAQIDAENLADAYRLRRFFKSDPDYIHSALLPYKTMSQKLIEQITQCADNKALTEVLEDSRFMKSGKMDEDFIENLTLRERERVSRKELRYSTHPAVTLVSYMTQTQIELTNLTNIIEGIRYGLNPVDIQKLLILPA